MHNVKISQASLDDIPHLCNLLHTLFSQEVEFISDRVLQESALKEMIDTSNARILKAELHGEIVGMVTLQYMISTALGGKVAILEDMIVQQKARGLTIGQRLLEEAICLAKRDGSRRITLLTDSGNTRAQRFYERGGFGKSSMIPMRLLFFS